MYGYVVRRGEVVKQVYGVEDLAKRAVIAGLGDNYLKLEMNQGVNFLIHRYTHWKVELTVTGEIIKIESNDNIDHFSQAYAEVRQDDEHEWVLDVYLWAKDREEIKAVAEQAFSRWMQIDKVILKKESQNRFEESQAWGNEFPELR